MAKKVTAKLYDGITPFNNVPVAKINAAWGDEPHVLIYVDGKFSGQACELGSWTLKQWQQYYQDIFNEQETQEAEAQAKAEEEAAKASEQEAQLKRIEEGTTQLLADIKSEAVDQYTLELLEAGLL